METYRGNMDGTIAYIFLYILVRARYIRMSHHMNSIMPVCSRHAYTNMSYNYRHRIYIHLFGANTLSMCVRFC